MINILIPLAGKNTFEPDENHIFPLLLSELDGKMLIERAAKPFLDLDYELNIIVVSPKKSIIEYQLDKILSLIDANIKLVAISDLTQGAISSALLAIEELNLSKPLIISSFEQVLNINLNPYVQEFVSQNVDGGVLTFESLHPKWSYVRIDQGLVIEASEKKPISKNAIAGLFYFKKAENFIQYAQNIIRKDIKINNQFYISSTINEIILNSGNVLPIKIPNHHYYYIKDRTGLDSYSNSIISTTETIENTLREKTNLYVSYFNNKDINAINELVDDNFTLQDNAIRTNNKSDTIDYINKIFKNYPDLQFHKKNIYITKSYISFIEFELSLGDKKIVGVDILKWGRDFTLQSLTAYLYEEHNESK